ncbi:hypothetical protein ES288_D04G117400v1 [Gossypium darwinii]|uniref:Uncharacterized protein n=1 Tax=Gossypium darwinii TaxID=34276 RepID=A0A5D2CXY9_GOSDA|nr:hypothetical protein ES288_D04G117400v1 [Gossypium darwinii]
MEMRGSFPQMRSQPGAEVHVWRRCSALRGGWRRADVLELLTAVALEESRNPKGFWKYLGHLGQYSWVLSKFSIRTNVMGQM